MNTPTPWIQTNSQLFFSRKDHNDLRWGDFVIPDSPELPRSAVRVGLWGYSDDTGIRLNGGRPGAQFAPEFIRRFFYRLTPPEPLPQPVLADYGDWLAGSSLDQQISLIAPKLTSQLLRHPMVTLGGGHDYGAVDGSGFLEWHQKTQSAFKPLIINFDAHLDVRPWQAGLNSGTPFSWLIDKYPGAFDFIEVGIQTHCSSPKHHQWVKDHGGRILTLDYIQKVGLLNALRQELAGTASMQHCFVSLDIDVFSQSLAPGCSQSWDAGLGYQEVRESLHWLLLNKKVPLLGLYEVSPPLDSDHRTSKLAACLIDDFIRLTLRRGEP